MTLKELSSQVFWSAADAFNYFENNGCCFCNCKSTKLRNYSTMFSIDCENCNIKYDFYRSSMEGEEKTFMFDECNYKNYYICYDQQDQITFISFTGYFSITIKDDVDFKYIQNIVERYENKLILLK